MPRKLIQMYPLKGMDQSLHSTLGTASLVENMRWDRRGIWRTAYGYERLANVTDAEGNNRLPTSGLFWYDTDFGGRRWLVWEQKESATQATSKIVYYDFSAGAVATIDGDRYWTDTPWIGTQYLAIGDDLYFVNGTNAPKRWDTVKAVQAGFSELPAAPLVDDRDDIEEIELQLGAPTGLRIQLTGTDAYNQYYDRSSMGGAGTIVVNGSSVTAGAGFRAFGGKNQRGVGERYPYGDPAKYLGDPVASYGYAVTYLNELGMESPLSKIKFAKARTFPYSGQRSVALQLDNPPPHVTAIRIYRTKNLSPSDYKSAGDGAGTMIRFPLVNFSVDVRPTDTKLNVQEQEVYLLDQVAACGPQIYTDTKSDADLGIRYDFEATGLWPHGATLLAWHGGRLWASGTQANPDRLFFSHPVYREQWPVLNYLTLPDRITALHDAGEVLYVFTATSCHVVWEDESQRPRMQTISNSVGTEAPNGVVLVPDVGLCFISATGIWALQGKDRMQLVSGPLEKLWDEQVFAGTMRQAHAWVDTRSREAWFHIPANGNFVASLGLVMHFETRQWSIRTNYPASRFVQTTDGSNRVYMASHDTTATYNGIFLYGPGHEQQAGTAMVSRWKSNWVNLGDIHESDRYLQLQVGAIGYGSEATRKLTMAWYGNRSRINQSDAPDMSPLHVENEDEYASWGATTWDTSLWKEYEHVLVRQDLFDYYGNPGVTAREFKFEVSASKMGLSGIGIEVDRAARTAPVETQQQNVESGT